MINDLHCIIAINCVYRYSDSIDEQNPASLEVMFFFPWFTNVSVFYA